MHKTLTSCATVVAATVLSVVGLTAPAYAYSSISVDSPNGDEYASGAEVTVTGYNDSADVETLYVECTNSYRSPQADVDPGAFSVSVGSFTGPDTCRIRDWYTEDKLATFTVAAPRTTVSDASVGSDSFYPLVRDGFKDSVVFHWRQDHRARATIRVVNSDAKTVRKVTPRASRGRNSWTWNGKNNSANPVPKGRYRITVTANANKVSAPVSVRTEIVTRGFSSRREGNEGASFSTRGNCYARRDSYYQIANLDCWGGSYAKASYRFVIPANAFDVDGTVNLRKSDADICCRGRITRGWSRTSKRTVGLWARVTKWRATEVNFVRVTYKRKVRI